ncbi:DUF4268 domain-containing protein [Halorubellus litoreus]|uniref:DUF4268 domain-containing protein n=1 Tax=Halorubellus litoreus TaxID=755308 RepID=A0ABD5VIH0_9EURY
MNEARQQFWRELNERIREREDTPLRAMERADAENDNWRKQPTMASSLGVGFNVRLDGQMLVYLIPRDREKREEMFDFLRDFKSEIDAEFDGRLEWRPPDQSTKIIVRRKDVDIGSNRARWSEYQNWLIENGEQFFTVFRPYARRYGSH